MFGGGRLRRKEDWWLVACGGEKEKAAAARSAEEEEEGGWCTTAEAVAAVVDEEAGRRRLPIAACALLCVWRGGHAVAFLLRAVKGKADSLRLPILREIDQIAAFNWWLVGDR